jgi:LmbE family N-acetylglucosaminyl deacetylase/SAM-dependent methyltransferase
VVTFDPKTTGTSAEQWRADPRMGALMPLDLEGAESVTVVAAHPDDESLGAGGLIVECSTRGIPVTVIVVTDGAGSHPASPTHSTTDVAVLRSAEVRDAVALLAPSAIVQMLGYPDGTTTQNEANIERDLSALIPTGTLLVAPWRGDGHRDHRVIAEICARIATSRHDSLLEYPIWLWHWAKPRDPSVPWSGFRRLPLSEAAVATKQAALSAHRTQIDGLGPDRGNEPVLLPEFLENFASANEVFVATYPAGDAISREYFEQLYERRDDPWRLTTRWYERRKRAITMASLPRARFARGLEIGSSVGLLTAELAKSCDELVAVDISAHAVELARARTRDLPNVRVLNLDATSDLPAGKFDLVILSEVGYFWSSVVLTQAILNIKEQLTEDAVVLACHWRHEVADYLLAGDEVQRVIREASGLPLVATHLEEDFRIDVLGTDGRSVARREGLVE